MGRIVACFLTTDDFGDVINPIPQYVVSSTLTQAYWENTTVIPGDEAALRVAGLRAATTGTIAMSGCATTVRWPLAEGLLDELVLLVDPIPSAPVPGSSRTATAHRWPSCRARCSGPACCTCATPRVAVPAAGPAS